MISEIFLDGIKNAGLLAQKCIKKSQIAGENQTIFVYQSIYKSPT
jgi:hypothetical protein